MTAPAPDRLTLQHIADAAMVDRGLWPEFSSDAIGELAGLVSPPPRERPSAGARGAIRDLTALPWCSIDNDDSRDLDQLTVSTSHEADAVTVLIAVADVDALVASGSAIDAHARHNTTSVYTAAKIFPMLPERLSTDLTSLNPGEDRLAVVVEMTIGGDGAVGASHIYRALVRNQAKLAYNGIAAWLDGHGPTPADVRAIPGLAENLRAQDDAARRLQSLRHQHGALDLDTIRARPVFDGDRVRGLDAERKNRAKEMIEDFMIAANGETARYLASRNVPSIRRVVQTPKRWDRIVALAAGHGTTLPAAPDSKALDAFLSKRRAADPVRFPDVSLAVVKLLGAGEYVAERPGAVSAGHFGLAVKDYAHSTAPNRRYGDLVTQRLLKAAVTGESAPYTYEELDALATHFTRAEDAANKVERQVGKSAAALYLRSRVGDRFAAIVTGVSEKGTWARLIDLPVEGRIVSGYEGADVGDRVDVELVATDVRRGFIDFERVPSSRPARSA